MQIKTLGHAVLKVHSLERSAAFYRDLLACARWRATVARWCSFPSVPITTTWR